METLRSGLVLSVVLVSLCPDPPHRPSYTHPCTVDGVRQCACTRPVSDVEPNRCWVGVEQNLDSTCNKPRITSRPAPGSGRSRFWVLSEADIGSEPARSSDITKLQAGERLRDPLKPPDAPRLDRVQLHWARGEEDMLIGKSDLTRVLEWSLTLIYPPPHFMQINNNYIKYYFCTIISLPGKFTLKLRLNSTWPDLG